MVMKKHMLICFFVSILMDRWKEWGITINYYFKSLSLTIIFSHYFNSLCLATMFNNSF
jgi:hypothetical protein